MLSYMSIAILKKKSRNTPRIAPISGKGHDGFSLNGGHRNIGAVGQFRMVSNTTRTPFKGNLPRGHGGNGGKYYDHYLNSGSCCTNDNTIIKKSTLNTPGMIDTKYKWTKGTYPNYWVKEDDNSYNLTRDQNTYVHNLTQTVSGGGNGCQSNFINSQSNSMNNNGTTDNSNGVYNCSGNRRACSYFIGTKKYIRTPYAKNFNQPAMSQGQYIDTGGVARNNCLPTPANKQPFPMTINHSSGCQSNYLTWQDAVNAGVLPMNWQPGN
jgi:hypothetical protein